MQYTSHMRAQFFDESQQPVATIDGQFITLDALQIICDGQYVAEYNGYNHKWLVKRDDSEPTTQIPVYAHRVVFTYVDENQRTLPDN